MSEKLTDRRIITMMEETDFGPSEGFFEKMQKEFDLQPEASSALSSESRTHRRTGIVFAGVTVVAVLVLGLILKGVLFPHKAYADNYSFEAYDFGQSNSPTTTSQFDKNFKQSSEMIDRFHKELPYSGKYKAANATGTYTVNSITADGYPDYYAGNYINVDGKVIVLVKETYYEKNYRKCDWYKELAGLFGSEDFACRPVKYNYTDLINGMSDATFGGLSNAMKDAGVEAVSIGFYDPDNRIKIRLKSEEDAAKVKALLPSDMFWTEVVGEQNVWW